MRRYNFQHSFAAIKVVEMYKDKKFKEIICEYEDDIIIKTKDNKFIFYQIKSTEKDYFNQGDPAIYNGILKYINLGIEDQQKYKAFNFITNRIIRGINSTVNDPIKLSSIKNGTIIKKIKKLKLDQNQVYNCLDKITLMITHDFGNIDSTLRDQLFDINILRNLAGSTVIEIARRILQMVYSASTNEYENNPEYITTTSEDERKRIAIEHKTITIKKINRLIRNYLTEINETVPPEQIISITETVPPEQIISIPAETLVNPTPNEINQYIEEIKSPILDTRKSLNYLEKIARTFRLYNNKKFLKVFENYIFIDPPIGELDAFLDVLKRMLFTSAKLDLKSKFPQFVKKKYLDRLKKIILTTDQNYDNSKLFSMQIIEDYLLDKNEILDLYWEALKKFITIENYNRYFRSIQYPLGKISNSDFVFKNKVRSDLHEIIATSQGFIRERALHIMDFFS